MPSSTPPISRPSLEELTARADYLTRVADVVRRISAARDGIRAVELLQDATTRMGAEVSLFGSFVPEDRTGASYRLLLNCDPQWSTEYEEQGAYSEDPWLSHALTSSEPIRGSELTPRSDAQHRVVELAERFGFRSSVIVPAPSSGRLTRMGLLCLGSSTPDFFEGDGYVAFKMVARSVAMEFHEWWLARVRDELITGAAIDDHDRHLLTLVAAGHSSKEIGRQMTLSTAAVDSRFRRIRERLDVRSRRAASVLAAEYGLIQPPATARSRR